MTLVCLATAAQSGTARKSAAVLPAGMLHYRIRRGIRTQWMAQPASIAHSHCPGKQGLPNRRIANGPPSFTSTDKPAGLQKAARNLPLL